LNYVLEELLNLSEFY